MHDYSNAVISILVLVVVLVWVCAWKSVFLSQRETESQSIQSAECFRSVRSCRADLDCDYVWGFPGFRCWDDLTVFSVREVHLWPFCSEKKCKTVSVKLVEDSLNLSSHQSAETCFWCGVNQKDWGHISVWRLILGKTIAFFLEMQMKLAATLPPTVVTEVRLVASID